MLDYPGEHNEIISPNKRETKGSTLENGDDNGIRDWKNVL